MNRDDEPSELPDRSGAFGALSGEWSETGPVPLSGRYAREGLLGSGGMGDVYVARDEVLRREVALKVARADVRLEQQARLVREARIMASLDHPGIVPVHELGTDAEGRPYYTMRVVRGRTLGQAITEAGDLEARLRLLRRLLAACEAMAHAHARGVVHRDLKPDNVLLGPHGETQVMDWGLARPLDGVESEWNELLSMAGTQTEQGLVLGTPAYMSPEQAQGHPVGPPSDVWSLGMMLHELVTGQRAFRATSNREVLVRVLAGPPAPLSELQPDTPQELVAIVAKALKADASRRYPDAGALAEDLRAYLDGRRVAAHTYTAGDELRRFVVQWRGPLLVGAVAAVALVGVAGWAFVRGEEERRRLREVEAELQEALAIADASVARTQVQRALLAARGDDLGRAQLLAAHALTYEEDPDARGVVMDASAHPRLLQRQPLEDCKLAALATGRVVCGSEDGAWVEGDDGSRQMVLRRPIAGLVGGGWNGFALLQPDRYAGLLLDLSNPSQTHSLRADPIGETVGASARVGHFVFFDPDNTTRVVEPIAGGGDREVTLCRGSFVMQVVHAPDDSLYAFCQDLTVRGGPGGVEQRVAVLPPNGFVHSVGLSGDGRRVAVGELYGTVRVLDVPGFEEVWSTSLGRARIDEVALSRNGRWLGVRAPGGGVRLFDLDAGREHRLPRLARSIGFTPDDRLRLLVEDRVETWALPDDSPGDTLAFKGIGVTGLTWTEGGLGVATGNGFAHVLPGEGVVRYADFGEVTGGKAAAVASDGTVLFGSLFGLFRARPGSDPEPVTEALVRRVLRLGDGWLVVGIPTRVIGPDLASERLVERLFHGVEANVSPDGRHAVVVGIRDRLLRITDGSLPTVDNLGDHEVDALAVLNGGSPVLVGGPTGVSRLEPSGQLTPWVGTGARVTDLAVSPGQRWLAIADAERRIWLVSLPGGEVRARLRGHERRVTSLAFSPDGRWLASGSWDDRVRFWDLRVLDQDAAALVDHVSAAWGLGLDDLNAP